MGLAGSIAEGGTGIVLSKQPLLGLLGGMAVEGPRGDFFREGNWKGKLKVNCAPNLGRRKGKAEGQSQGSIVPMLPRDVWMAAVMVLGVWVLVRATPHGDDGDLRRTPRNIAEQRGQLLRRPLVGMPTMKSLLSACVKKQPSHS